MRLVGAIAGDSDTIACIAGSIAEAYYGVPESIAAEAVRRLPDEMLDVIKKFSILCQA